MAFGCLDCQTGAPCKQHEGNYYPSEGGTKQVSLDALQCPEVKGGVRCREWLSHGGPHTWDKVRFTQADLDAAVAAERDAALEFVRRWADAASGARGDDETDVAVGLHAMAAGLLAGLETMFRAPPTKRKLRIVRYIPAQRDQDKIET